ncbi:Tryptophan--tRNA ligase [Gossypium arboreum]|uniref:Tryptophan--tRNA ligase n=1 Tax=Gossypium arboreum TaxID=29729 RepID=A0A0B0NQM0_GOSAR|nr:Tryptophan--tRNA ligase [Gossypium arboreum]
MVELLHLLRTHYRSYELIDISARKSLLFLAHWSLPIQLRFVSSLVPDKSELHITLSNFRLGGKMALQIAYFCPHGQGHKRVS